MSEKNPTTVSVSPPEKVPGFEGFPRSDFKTPDWAAKFEFDPIEHRYYNEGIEIPSVSSLLKEFGLVDDRWFTEESRQRGQAIHTLCHYDDIGILRPESIDPQFAPYLEVWRKFRQETGFKPVFRERPLFSRFNAYGVTPDAFGHINGVSCIAEIKTGQVYPKAVKLQLAAQKIAIGEWFGIYAENSIVVQLKPNDFKVWQFEPLDNAEEIFLGLVKVHHFKKEKHNE